MLGHAERSSTESNCTVDKNQPDVTQITYKRTVCIIVIIVVVVSIIIITM